MTYLTPHLGFQDRQPSSVQAIPPAGSHLIITDTLNSPGQFATYHLVSAAIHAKRKIIWVDFRGEGRASWESVLKKLGTPLPPTSSTNFVRIAPSALDFPITGSTGLNSSLFDGATPTLRPTFDTISLAISSNPNESTLSYGDGPLIILDGTVELSWIGFTPSTITQFVRATLSLARKSNSTLISTLHADHLPLNPSSPSAPDSPSSDLLGQLLRLGGGGWWRVSNLSSGRSGDVHGEISSHPLYPLSVDGFPDVPKSLPLQYRLEASTVKVFPKGTGRGFL